MKIKYLPFKLNVIVDPKSPLSQINIIEEMLKGNIPVYEIYHKKRSLSVKRKPGTDYVAGILLSEKDYEMHCKAYRNPDGSYSTQIDEIKDGTEYNFFLLNQKTLKGVWLTYFTSAAVSTFGKILDRYLREYARNGKRIEKGFSKKNKIESLVIVSEETAENALRKFSEISRIEFFERNTKQNHFSPDDIRSKKVTLSLKRERFRELVGTIKSLYEGSETERIKVTGKNREKDEWETINLDNIFRPWDESDYDKVTQTLRNFDTKNLLEHPIIKKLTGLIENDPKHKQIIEE